MIMDENTELFAANDLAYKAFQLWRAKSKAFINWNLDVTWDDVREAADEYTRLEREYQRLRMLAGLVHTYKEEE